MPRLLGWIGCCLALTASLAGGTPVFAAVCSLDPVPAATLLLPYFEVDLANPGGITTLLSINNAGSRAVLANMVLWTDLGVPTLSVPIYLTGYDVQTINLQNLFRGLPPGTASAGEDPNDTISPKGIFSEDIDFASCAGQLPPPPIDNATLAHLAAAHTGRRSEVLGGCAGTNIGDGLARGYITVDTVSSCSLDVRFPTDPGYFKAGGLGRATDQNVLWGDYFLLDPQNNRSGGEALVRLEAAPGRFAAGDTTFYGRTVGYSGADDREPLATTWAGRFVSSLSTTAQTDFIIWRDPQQPGLVFDCAFGPTGWYPLYQKTAVVFDEQEHAYQYGPVFVPIPVPCPPNCGVVPAPAVANRVRVGYANLPVPFNFGWFFFDSKSPVAASDPHAQSYLAAILSIPGRFSVQTVGTALDSACSPKTCIPGVGSTCP